MHENGVMKYNVLQYYMSTVKRQSDAERVTRNWCTFRGWQRPLCQVLVTITASCRRL